MSSASKVGEIFCEAGQAFTTLATMTARLQTGSGPHGWINSGRWSEEEIQQLHQAVEQFGSDLQRISEVIKSRSVNQIRHALKRRALDGGGGQQGDEASPPTRPQKSKGAGRSAASSAGRSAASRRGSGVSVLTEGPEDPTLNMLNAGPSEAEAVVIQGDFFQREEEIV